MNDTDDPTAPGGTEIQSDDTTDIPPAEPGESPNAEAAKWRKQLREAQQRSDQLAAQVEALQRQQVEAAIGLSGIKPAALWAVTELADLLDDNGGVDNDKVAAAVERARDELGVQPVGKGNYVPGVGTTPSGNLTPRNAFADAFKPRTR